MTDLYLSFGAMADPIRAQLKEQRVTVIDKDIDHAQKDADAITRLIVRGLIGDTDARKVRQRIIRNLTRSGRLQR